MSTIDEELFRGVVRNLSRLIILWLLNNKSYSGYGLLKEMKRVTGQDFRPGIIYPLLYELEKSKYIEGNTVQEGKREITYYLITAEGVDLLDNLRRIFEQPLGPLIHDLLGKT